MCFNCCKYNTPKQASTFTLRTYSHLCLCLYRCLIFSFPQSCNWIQLKKQTLCCATLETPINKHAAPLQHLPIWHMEWLAHGKSPWLAHGKSTLILQCVATTIFCQLCPLLNLQSLSRMYPVRYSQNFVSQDCSLALHAFVNKCCCIMWL